MLNLFLASLYFILPAYIGNMFPVLTGKARLPFGKTISMKYFGANKTYRGFYSAFLGALLCLYMQYYFQEKGYFSGIEIIDYKNINLFLYAFSFGIGAMTGDLIKSFFKRILKKSEGDPWVPLDQIDFILGAYIFLLPLYIIPFNTFIILILVTPIVHFLGNILGYLLGLKKVWW